MATPEEKAPLFAFLTTTSQVVPAHKIATQKVLWRQKQWSLPGKNIVGKH
jgi:hypothetical protein